MSAFFAAIQSYFVAAVTFIANTQAWLMVLAAVTYMATVLVTTFGLSVAVATGIAYALFALAAAVLLWGAVKGCKWIAPMIAKGYNWAKAKVVGLFKKEAKPAAEVVELKAVVTEAAAA